MTSHDETFPTTPMSRTISSIDYHVVCAGCVERDQRIAELELALRACEAAVDSQAARIADLEEDLAQAREGHANAH